MIWKSLATIHANSKETEIAIQDVLNAVYGLQLRSKKWILVGDMNCTPEELQSNEQFKRHYNGFVSIVATQEATRENKVFDYMILPSNMANCRQTVRLGPKGISDHYPVYLLDVRSFLDGGLILLYIIIIELVERPRFNLLRRADCPAIFFVLEKLCII